MAIRNAAKAMILHDGKILVNKCVSSQNVVYYDLPGGGQNQFETMEDALQREVLEETGYHVKITRFAALAEEIYDNPQVREKHFDYSHRILHIFIAELRNESIAEPTEMDHQQQTSLWLTLDAADRLPFRPSQLTGKISALVNLDTPQYLGYVRVS